jgi:hypothetical protein
MVRAKHGFQEGERMLGNFDIPLCISVVRIAISAENGTSPVIW